MYGVIDDMFFDLKSSINICFKLKNVKKYKMLYDW